MTALPPRADVNRDPCLRRLFTQSGHVACQARRWSLPTLSMAAHHSLAPWINAEEPLHDISWSVSDQLTPKRVVNTVLGHWNRPVFVVPIDPYFPLTIVNDCQCRLRAHRRWRAHNPRLRLNSNYRKVPDLLPVDHVKQLVIMRFIWANPQSPGNACFQALVVLHYVLQIDLLDPA